MVFEHDYKVKRSDGNMDVWEVYRDGEFQFSTSDVCACFHWIKADSGFDAVTIVSTKE